MKQKLISVVLPAYNAENTIEKAIKSVLAQTYSNFELIIVNDGSKDNTENICKSFLKDSRIKYFFQKNKGVSYTRNFAIEKSTGEYITFIDSDDLYDSFFLEELFNLIENKENVDWGICAYSIIGNGNIISHEKDFTTDDYKYVIETIQPKMLYNHLWNKIYKSSIIKNNGIKFNLKLNLGEDYVFNLEYMKNCKYISYINKPLYKYDVNTSGLSTRKRENRFEIKQELLEKLDNLYDEMNYSKDYIYKSHIINYLSFYGYISREKLSLKEKTSRIKKITKDEKTISLINNLNKCNSFKFKSVFRIVVTMPSICLLTLGKIAMFYDAKVVKRKLKEGESK